jgi:hypothetical protein
MRDDSTGPALTVPCRRTTTQPGRSPPGLLCFASVLASLTNPTPLLRPWMSVTCTAAYGHRCAAVHHIGALGVVPIKRVIAAAPLHLHQPPPPPSSVPLASRSHGAPCCPCHSSLQPAPDSSVAAGRRARRCAAALRSPFLSRRAERRRPRPAPHRHGDRAELSHGPVAAPPQDHAELGSPNAEHPIFVLVARAHRAAMRADLALTSRRSSSSPPKLLPFTIATSTLPTP